MMRDAAARRPSPLPTIRRSASASLPSSATTRRSSRISSWPAWASALDPAAMFDVQVKRIHEYKRQLLNILETIALYNAMRAHPDRPWVPRVKIFAGKAAASYAQAKLIIKLVNDVAQRRQQRSGHPRSAEGRVHPQLQCQPGGSDRPGGRPVGADLDGRHGSLGHRQHEVRAERRADHRHARWRQCRDPASMWAETTSSSSA